MRLSLLLPVCLALFAASVQPAPKQAAVWLEDSEPDPVIAAPLDLPRVELAAKSGDLAWFRREVTRLTLIDPGGLESIRYRNLLRAEERRPLDPGCDAYAGPQDSLSEAFHLIPASGGRICLGVGIVKP